MQPRGIRNNNPGNIQRSSDAWLGLADEQSDPEYFQFVAPEWGIRAMAKVLETYQRDHGLRTVRGIIGRWAPAPENPTEQYINYVAGALGVSPDQRIEVSEHVGELVRAIIRFENGAQPYPATVVDDGIARAYA